MENANLQFSINPSSRVIRQKLTSLPATALSPLRHYQNHQRRSFAFILHSITFLFPTAQIKQPAKTDHTNLSATNYQR